MAEGARLESVCRFFLPRVRIPVSPLRKTEAYETILLDFASLFSPPKRNKSDIAPIFEALTNPGEFDFDILYMKSDI